MELIPFVGIGDIQFGISRHEIRNLLGTEFTSFKKTQKSKSETDAYDKIGVYLYYDHNDCLEFLELFSPFKVTFKNIYLLECQGGELKDMFVNAGIDFMDSAVGYDVPEFGFGIYLYEGRVDGICLYRKGYYDTH